MLSTWFPDDLFKKYDHETLALYLEHMQKDFLQKNPEKPKEFLEEIQYIQEHLHVFIDIFENAEIDVIITNKEYFENNYFDENGQPKSNFDDGFEEWGNNLLNKEMWYKVISMYTKNTTFDVKKVPIHISLKIQQIYSIYCYFPYQFSDYFNPEIMKTKYGCGHNVDNTMSIVF